MATSDRLVLEGVPRVSFGPGGATCPENIPFPSVMRALMQYFGEGDLGCRSSHALPPGCKVPCSYSFFIGVSGVAAFLSWKPGWASDNVEISYMSDDPAAPFDRALRATGYEYQHLGTDLDETSVRKRIRESIQGGRPVLAFGPVGPPESAIITGYDEGGDVLIGWSFFQDMPDFNAGVEFEPSGQFRKRDWHAYPPGFYCIILGKRKRRPPLSETFRQALEWMREVANTPLTCGDRHNGLAAYDAWAEHLLRDDDFKAGDEAIRQSYSSHDQAVGMVAEARWYGSQFLIQASDPDVLPYRMAEDLLHAAACYAAEHDLMWRLWDLAGGNGNPQAHLRLADPEVRRQMAEVIRQAREKDAQAAEHIARALAKG
ncbi:MAG: hypothetical protein RDU89_10495 [bacterium]|nr:hypothetical protein [bacterium]